jgi:predicted component of type VI protein secretion system
MSASPAASIWLVPISGPPLRSVQLMGDCLTIGRQEQCDIRLPNDAVSRSHARLRYDDGRWRLADLKSRWGTFLNGCRIHDADIPLQGGDLIRISPWTFNFSVGDASSSQSIRSIDNIERRATVLRAPGKISGAVAENLLSLLLDSAAAFHDAPTDRALAEALLDAACKGSQMPNGAVFRPIDTDGNVELIAARQIDSAAPTFSRSLIAAASNGDLAQYAPSDGDDASQSILTLQIDAAMCAALMLGDTPAAYLYLDARAPREERLSQHWTAGTSFCLALARISSLALANLKRIDLERRMGLGNRPVP